MSPPTELPDRRVGHASPGIWPALRRRLAALRPWLAAFVVAFAAGEITARLDDRRLNRDLGDRRVELRQGISLLIDVHGAMNGARLNDRARGRIRRLGPNLVVWMGHRQRRDPDDEASRR